MQIHHYQYPLAHQNSTILYNIENQNYSNPNLLLQVDVNQIIQKRRIRENWKPESSMIKTRSNLGPEDIPIPYQAVSKIHNIVVDREWVIWSRSRGNEACIVASTRCSTHANTNTLGQVIPKIYK